MQSYKTTIQSVKYLSAVAIGFSSLMALTIIFCDIGKFLNGVESFKDLKKSIMKSYENCNLGKKGDKFRLENEKPSNNSINNSKNSKNEQYEDHKNKIIKYERQILNSMIKLKQNKIK